MKSKKKIKSYKTVNHPPGTVYYKGEKQSKFTTVDIINYSHTSYTKIETQNVAQAFGFKDNNQVTWINVNGLNNTLEIEKLGNHYDLHPLTIEDIVNTGHRPKIDEFDGYIFVVLKMFYFKKDKELIFEHLGMVVGDGYVLTFQEADVDVFDDLRTRIASAKGRVRNLGADYLMYAIIDAVVDHYITVIDVFGDKIEALEDEVFKEGSDNSKTASAIQALKRELLKIRRSVLPLRDVIGHLEKIVHPIVEEKTHSFLRDLYDHIIQVTESVEMYREMLWSLMDMYMSIISNKMNEVMKVLTIIATVFIPLTFIAGIYGMNFDNMPELHYKNGYFIILGIMALIFVLMLIYFRRRKWL